jgi:hypothetical protein|tara:strand:+ start:194 stop:298 length:105 start_codon:yes stop_codon:yes gene_type:complete
MDLWDDAPNLLDEFFEHPGLGSLDTGKIIAGESF